MQRNVDKHQKTRGYTLIEMVIVVAIIAILLGLAATAMKKLSTAEGVNSGIPIVKAKFEEARQLAIGRGVPTRVAVLDGDGGQGLSDKAFRYLAVFANDQADGLGDWVQVGKAEELPVNCFFLDSSSRGARGVEMPYKELGDQSSLSFTFNFLGAPIIGADLFDEASDVTDTDAQLFVLTSGRINRGEGESFAVISDTNPDRAAFAVTKYGNILDVQKNGIPNN